MPQKGEFKAGASKRSKQQRKYNSSPEQKKRRAARNATRSEMAKKGRVRKGDGKDIDHKDFNPSNKSASNLRVVSKKKNRARNRGTGGRPKGS
jgi:hypothetical protein